jgi:hypothetical protein
MTMLIYRDSIDARQRGRPSGNERAARGEDENVVPTTTESPPPLDDISSPLATALTTALRDTR